MATVKSRKISSLKRFTKLVDQPVQAENADGLPVEFTGLAGALERGAAARIGWVERGEVIQGVALADAWGLTRQALRRAVVRGELFAVKVSNHLFYPREFLLLEHDIVANICKALGNVSSSEKLIFWKRTHGSLAGETIVQALRSNVPRERIVALAQAWAAERGVGAPVPASAGAHVANEAASLNEILAVPGNWIDRHIQQHFMELLASDKLIPTGSFLARSGWTERTLSRAEKAKQIFHLEVLGVRAYPWFFLDQRLDMKAVGSVCRLMQDLSSGSKWEFFTTPLGSLATPAERWQRNGTPRTPLQALEDGDVEAVKRAAVGFLQT